MLTRRLFCFVVVSLLSTALPLMAREIHEGKVLAVGASSITIRDARDIEDDRILVTAETKITRNGKPAKLSDIGLGDKAKIDASEVDGKLTAKSIEAFMPQ